MVASPLINPSPLTLLPTPSHLDHACNIHHYVVLFGLSGVGGGGRQLREGPVVHAEQCRHLPEHNAPARGRHELEDQRAGRRVVQGEEGAAVRPYDRADLQGAGGGDGCTSQCEKGAAVRPYDCKGGRGAGGRGASAPTSLACEDVVQNGPPCMAGQMGVEGI